MSLELRNVNNEFYIISTDEETIISNADLERRYSEIYYDPVNNNKIVFAEYRFTDEPVEKTIAAIIDYCMGRPYDYLCQILNDFENVCVYMRQIYRTTADYTIMYDCADTINSVKDVDAIISKVKRLPFKFLELKNGECHKLWKMTESGMVW